MLRHQYWDLIRFRWSQWKVLESSKQIKLPQKKCDKAIWIYLLVYIQLIFMNLYSFNCSYIHKVCTFVDTLWADEPGSRLICKAALEYQFIFHLIIISWFDLFNPIFLTSSFSHIPCKHLAFRFKMFYISLTIQ